MEFILQSMTTAKSRQHISNIIQIHTTIIKRTIRLCLFYFTYAFLQIFLPSHTSKRSKISCMTVHNLDMLNGILNYVDEEKLQTS